MNCMNTERVYLGALHALDYLALPPEVGWHPAGGANRQPDWPAGVRRQRT